MSGSSISWHLKSLVLFCTAAVWLCACPVVPTNEPVTDGGVSDSAPQDGVAQAQTAFVVNLFEESGAFGLIDTGTRIARPQVGPASNDAVARYFDGYIYIVNRLTHDNIQVMDVSNWQLVKQYSVGPKSNPQDIVVVNPKKAYISRLADPKLLIVEPLTGKQLGEIDLSALSETSDQACQRDEQCDANKCIEGFCARDGIPELARMHLYKDRLFVLVQRLDRNRRFDALDKGMIAVINTTTDRLLQTIPTQGRNPLQIVSVDGGRRIYVSQVGRWLDGNKPVLDGMIESFDLDAMKSEGSVLTEQTLGGNLSSFAVHGDKGFAIRSGDQWQTELVSFSLSTGKVEKTLASSTCIAQGACFGFFQVALNALEQLYLVDRNQKQPGIRIFDANTEKEITAQPIDMGLPPSSVLFFP